MVVLICVVSSDQAVGAVREIEKRHRPDDTVLIVSHRPSVSGLLANASGIFDNDEIEKIDASELINTSSNPAIRGQGWRDHHTQRRVIQPPHCTLFSNREYHQPVLPISFAKFCCTFIYVHPANPAKPYTSATLMRPQTMWQVSRLTIYR